jgi:DNA-binding CsgD family transcriptional regulator
MGPKWSADGARPTLGWDSLTEAERRVADLVARGHSNKEIGERLHMSHRTVGSHLYRIFPKLSITSRVELARLVIERSLADLAA